MALMTNPKTLNEKILNEKIQNERILNGKTRVCGIIANPVEHSMSPLLQNLYAKRTGVNLAYVPFKVESTDVKAAVKGAFALNILGLNVTIPHKQSVMRYLVDTDETAKAIGAVNTLVRTEGGYKGYNTDVPGLLRAVTEAGMHIRDQECILIGAGGAAKAAAYMMAREGAAVIYVLNRSVSKAEELANYVNGMFGRKPVRPMALGDYGKIPKGKYFAVQSTSVGMHPNVEEIPIEDPKFYENICEAVEMIYTPSKTRFMKLTEAAGGRVINGVSMLLYQGVIAYELWNPGTVVGTDVIEEARQLILKKLASREAKGQAAREQAAREPAAKEKAGREPDRPEQRGTGRKNLILIGFMGAGKTSVGMYYSKKYGLPIMDTDQLIEITTGMTVSDIFEYMGEEAFRQKETQMLQNLLDTDSRDFAKTLISVGGGLPLRTENRKLLKELGTVIYLRVSPDTVLKRLEGDTTRPLMQGDNIRQRIETLVAAREPFYMEAAHGVVEVDGKDFEEIAKEIAEAIEVLENR